MADIKRPVREGDLLWTPSGRWIEQAHITRFSGWLADSRGLVISDYQSLWEWSVQDLDGFWQAIWDFFEVEASAPHSAVLGRRTMPGAEWFPGAQLNYAQHILRQEKTGAEALMFMSERESLRAVPWEHLAGQVRILATRMRELGIKRGDRVAAFMPNIPETVIAMLATTAIGAIWASVSPDFGSKGAVERLQQLQPKLLFGADGYQYGGKAFNRLPDLKVMIETIASIEHVVHLSYLDPEGQSLPVPHAISWDDFLDHPPIDADRFAFEQVGFDDPLWVLFSSGTTGLPKAIAHSHGGILLELLKSVHFHMDVRPGERAFFFTTTGWTMWNLLVSFILAGAIPVLYDGNPAYPNPDTLWGMAEQSGAVLFGASPSFVHVMMKAGIVPAEKYDLSKLRVIMPAGAPVSPEVTAWFYQAVKKDIWIATGSGGTDICSGFVGGVVTLPVYAGEVQARCLGVAAFAFNDAGERVVNEMGELVITEPMPSMPVFFWNDPQGEKYREAYFETWPGVWRQGDFFRVNGRGGCFVIGRSDATLNRHGIRIGTSEIYNALAGFPEIENALVVNLDLPGSHFFMPLFVKLKAGVRLEAELEKRIKMALGTQYTPRHVPDRIIHVPDIPMTISGKKLEVPVRRILMGHAVEKVANTNAMANPGSLDFFLDYAQSLEPMFKQ